MNVLKFLLGSALIGSLVACSGGGYGGSGGDSGGGSDPYNEPPTANAGPDQTVTEGDTVNLNGSGTDSDGTIDSYQWSQISGPDVTLNSPNSANASFTAPDTDSSVDLVFRLTVTDNGGATSTDEVTITVNPASTGSSVTVSGKITYDKVPHTSSSALDYPNTTQVPVRGATIQLLQNNSVIGSTKTDANGNYSFTTVPQMTDVLLRVRAELVQNTTQSWDVKIVDNTSSDALYALDSAIFSSGTSNQVKNLHADSGWDGSSYGSTRAAAPFHILDSAYITITKLQTVDANLQLSPLIINWSPNNISQSGNKSQGQITTSHYVNDQIFLLGAEDSDTDEYDGHVIIHEWGHYFEDNNARSDSIGGSHGGGDRLDMRVAFGEGFGNAWSGMMTDDPIYRDSFGSNQASGFSINVENNSVSNPGWFSEGSVQSILFDIYDEADDDGAALGLQAIYDVLIGQQRNTEAFTSIFSFMTYIKEENPGDSAALDALLTGQNIQTSVNIWGSNETDDEGQAEVLPVYHDFSAGDSKQLCTIHTFGSDNNKLGNRKFLRLNVSAAGSYTLRLTPSGSEDLDGYIFRQGNLVAFDDAFTSSTVNITGDFSAGTHVADVLAFDAEACFDVAFIQN